MLRFLRKCRDGVAAEYRRHQARWDHAAAVAREFAVAGVAGWVVAHLLARLSGKALWVPAEWRVAVEGIVGGFAGVVFAFTRSRLAHFYARWELDAEPTPDGTGTPAVEPRRQRRLSDQAKRAKVRVSWIALLLAVAAVFALAAFQVLKTCCVVRFDARDYLARQRAVDRRAAEADAREAATPDHAVAPAPAAPVDDPVGRPYAVDFVDVDQNRVYLPLWFPADIRAYLKAVGDTNGDDGLTYVLAHEPEHLFEMVSKQALFQTGVTDALFLLLDALFVGLLAAGAACSFDLKDALLGQVTDAGR